MFNHILKNKQKHDKQQQAEQESVILKHKLFSANVTELKAILKAKVSGQHEKHRIKPFSFSSELDI